MITQCKLDTIIERKSDVVSREFNDEFIIVPIKHGVGDLDFIYRLSDVGAFIWKNIDGKNTIQDIINQITLTYQIDNTVAETDVLSFLEEIKNLISYTSFS